MFFFSICVAVVFILFVEFILELEMHFFYSVLFFGTFRFTGLLRVYFFIYLDKEMKFFYKTIN